jgi:hypothetical protein
MTGRGRGRRKPNVQAAAKSRRAPVSATPPDVPSSSSVKVDPEDLLQKSADLLQKELGSSLKKPTASSGYDTLESAQLYGAQVSPQTTAERQSDGSGRDGWVRGTPYGAQLKSNDKQFSEWRQEHLKPLTFPVEGFDHVYGRDIINSIDDIDGYGDAGAEEAAMEAIGARQEYGSEKTPADSPVGSLKDKWRLLPHFLKLRGLMRQHIDSFDHFVTTEMKQIVQVSTRINLLKSTEQDIRFIYLMFVPS